MLHGVVVSSLDNGDLQVYIKATGLCTLTHDSFNPMEKPQLMDLIEVTVLKSKIVSYNLCHCFTTNPKLDTRYGTFQINFPVIFPSVNEAKEANYSLTKAYSPFIGEVDVTREYGEEFDKVDMGTCEVYSAWMSWHDYLSTFVIGPQSIELCSATYYTYDKLILDAPWCPIQVKKAYERRQRRIKKKHEDDREGVVYRLRCGRTYEVFTREGVYQLDSTSRMYNDDDKYLELGCYVKFREHPYDNSKGVTYVVQPQLPFYTRVLERREALFDVGGICLGHKNNVAVLRVRFFGYIYDYEHRLPLHIRVGDHWRIRITRKPYGQNEEWFVERTFISLPPHKDIPEGADRVAIEETLDDMWGEGEELDPSPVDDDYLHKWSDSRAHSPIPSPLPPLPPHDRPSLSGEAFGLIGRMRDVLRDSLIEREVTRRDRYLYDDVMELIQRLESQQHS